MFSTENDEHILESALPSVRLKCLWQGDRFAHCFQTLTDSRWCDLLASAEGTSLDAWPISPPFQELHRQPWMDGDCLLGIGKSGDGHWSLSIEPLADAIGFRFDVACRLNPRLLAGPLGTTYDPGPQMASRISCDSQVPGAAPMDANVEPEGCGQRLCLRAIHGGAWHMSDTEPPRWKFQPVVPATSEPHTVRWMYEVVVTNASA